MTFRRKLILTLIASLMLVACSGPQESPVEDQAGLLSAVEQSRLKEFQRHLLGELDIELKILVLGESPGDLDQEAVELFDLYRVGKRTRAARGVLLLIDPIGEQVRMEIGYDLEGIFPDGFIGYVEEKQMLPFFQQGRIGHGIEATVELLIGRALGEGQIPDFSEPTTALNHLSGGGGARIDVTVGSGAPEKGRVADPTRFMAGETPLATLQNYMLVLKERVKDPELKLYTPETRDFFSRWLVTDAQQDNELRSLLAVLDQGEVRTEGDRAVVFFPAGERRASPYFFRRGEEGWMLDFATMSRTIGFNHRNQWFFRTPDHAYMFAFARLGMSDDLKK